MLTDQELSAHAAAISERGYTILERVIAPELIATIQDAILRLERERHAGPASNIFEGTRTVRLYNLLAFGAPFTAIAEHAAVLPLVEKVLDSGCLVSSLSSIAIGPDETPQPWHADDQLIPLPRPHVPLVCNTMWAITDFTEENGATRFVPTTHQRADLPPPFGELDGALSAEMPAGSVLVYNGSMWHGGGANRTDRRRIGVAMNYCVGWMRQQENQQLGIPVEVARTFSPRLRKLVGYGLYKRLLGHIDKCSPVDILDGGAPRPIVGV